MKKQELQVRMQVDCWEGIDVGGFGVEAETAAACSKVVGHSSQGKAHCRTKGLEASKRPLSQTQLSCSNSVLFGPETFACQRRGDQGRQGDCRHADR